MRKTKVICTMGPATDRPGVLEQLALAGMNVARFNFSHGSHEEHAGRMAALRKIREEYHLPIAILLDTKGPEIRTKTFKSDKVELKKGQIFTLTGEDVEGDENRVSITCETLAKDVIPGTRILIDDGLVEMKVQSCEGLDIHCEVMNNGVISNRKGINVPEIHVSLPYLSDKDKSDLLFGIEQDVDFVAASFTRNADDVHQIRSFLDANGGRAIQLIAKIENREGVLNVDEIIGLCDGIMVARGDMGVEIPEEDVPVIQKMIIRKTRAAGKTVITATQMLDSMMKNPRPTRAEASDVANAIFDGTSATMLSGETAAGTYPLESLQTMIRIIERTERDVNYDRRFQQIVRSSNPDITDAICHATCTTAMDIRAKAIITVTKSGYSARKLSRYLPGCGIIGCATDERVVKQLNLVWGVTPILLHEEKDIFTLFTNALGFSKYLGYVKPGDVVVQTAGVPLGQSGTTNMMKVEIVS